MVHEDIIVETEESGKSSKKEITSKKIIEDFSRAFRHKHKWIKLARKDFEMFLGKQWDDNDVWQLEQVAVKPLTINKIQPNIFLLSGIQRQNRSDFMAFPEGEEDSLAAEIATKLLKNLMKKTLGEHRLSEEFEDGVICGEGWLEPHIDYVKDIIHGEMKLKKISAFHIFPDPKSEEYDVSDGRFLIKLKKDLDRDQLNELFPDKSSELDKIENGKIDLDNMLGGDLKVETDNYEDVEKNTFGEVVIRDKTFDLVEYYYKKPVKKFMVIDLESGDIEEFDNNFEAQEFMKGLEPTGIDTDKVKFVERIIPEIWLARMVGSKHILSNEVSWTYPRWKSFPFVPFKANWINVDIKDSDLLTQGYVRPLIDLQIELNKRRTQELRHLNQSANSGWLTPENAWTNKETVEKFGAVPGVNLEYDPDVGKPERLFPTPLSQGHAQLAAENAQDMKEVTGINSDLLSSTESDQSGRAIRLRQQQGFVMIQRVLDNFTLTKKILGRFLLTMLGEVYTISKVEKVLGESFIQQNFLKEEVVGQIQDPLTGQLVDDIKQTVNVELLQETIAIVLEDSQFDDFDVAIGESENSETAKISNFLMLRDLAEAGLPIPPDVLIDESLINASSKEKIKNSVEKAQAAQQEQVK